MYPGNFLPLIFVAAAANAIAVPELERRVTISTDGTCGGTNTCQGSTYGNCCSQYGYCGSASGYCGTGCQSGFGTCGTTSSSVSVVKSSTATSSKKATSASSSKTTTSSSITTSASSSKATSVVSSKSSAASSSLSTSASTTSAVQGCATQAVSNPSFESGLAPWTAGGGAVLKDNSEGSDFYFTGATDGTKYIQFESSTTYPSSTLTQSLDGLSANVWTLSYDWQYTIVTTGRGPPSTTCTLTATLGSSNNVVASWSRPGSQGGTGHVQETLSINIGAGDLVLTFSCTDPMSVFRGGVALDNVRFTSVC